MKSIVGIGPAKNASQDWSAGAIIRLRPTLVTSTWRTLFGNASALGMRTACVRFVVKTVERAILSLGCRGISREDIRRLSPPVKATSLSAKRIHRTTTLMICSTPTRLRFARSRSARGDPGSTLRTNPHEQQDSRLIKQTASRTGNPAPFINFSQGFCALKLKEQRSFAKLRYAIWRHE
jgi:hypothetical protein